MVLGSEVFGPLQAGGQVAQSRIELSVSHWPVGEGWKGTRTFLQRESQCKHVLWGVRAPRDVTHV